MTLLFFTFLILGFPAACAVALHLVRQRVLARISAAPDYDEGDVETDKLVEADPELTKPTIH